MYYRKGKKATQRKWSDVQPQELVGKTIQQTDEDRFVVNLEMSDGSFYQINCFKSDKEKFKDEDTYTAEFVYMVDGEEGYSFSDWDGKTINRADFASVNGVNTLDIAFNGDSRLWRVSCVASVRDYVQEYFSGADPDEPLAFEYTTTPLSVIITRRNFN